MVEEGEPVVTTPVHISEVANILESRVSLSSAASILEAMVGLRALEIHPLGGDHVKAAVTLSRRMGLGLNDTLAYIVMREIGVEEIFSFDRDFDGIPGLTRRTQ